METQELSSYIQPRPQGLPRVGARAEEDPGTEYDEISKILGDLSHAQ